MGSRVRIRLVHFFVHLEIGDAKELSPKNSESDVHLEMGDAKRRSPSFSGSAGFHLEFTKGKRMSSVFY